MEFEFAKYHALGNDYLVIEPKSSDFQLDKGQIIKFCHRHTGIGSDGILFGPKLFDGKINLQIFNPDGSEAEKSGNGLRIFAHHLYKNGFVKNKKFNISTLSGDSQVEILNEEASQIKINMGKASFHPKDIPLNSKDEWIQKPIKTTIGTEDFTCLSIGNPHAVFFPKKWSSELIQKIGPEIENNALFPNRINVQMARIVDAKTIEIEIWERGAGYTLASGSSSCAAAFVSNYLGYTSNNIEVRMPGGNLQIEILNSEVWMTGSVVPVFKGRAEY